VAARRLLETEVGLRGRTGARRQCAPSTVHWRRWQRLVPWYGGIEVEVGGGEVRVVLFFHVCGNGGKDDLLVLITISAHVCSSVH
jgi:hypothetical protein